MKIFSKYMFIALTACFSFAACSDDDKYSPGEQESANRAGVYFPSANISNIELDPVAATEFDITIARLNTEGSIEVPIIVQTNDGDVFQLPETAVFADGDAEATIKVNFPNAEIGNPYKLTVTVPKEFISLYKKFDGGVSYSLNVQRVKWNMLGNGQWLDGFWYGFGEEVTIEQRDDIPNMYRVSNPYTNELVDSYGEIKGTYTDNYVFTVNKDATVSWEGALYINTINSQYGAEMKGYYPSSLSPSIAENDALSIVEYDESGNILYFTINPYWYMDGVGGYGCYPCHIAFPGVDLINEWGWTNE